MRPATRAWATTWFALTTLVSAFLVFQVQPVISKTVLPWFGGSPAVWTTCMLFFQVLLFAGYAYAHLSTRLLSVRLQGAVHLLLLVAALRLLPITPGDAWKPSGDVSPVVHLLLTLTATVGLPYFVLSATAPLVQAWFHRQLPGISPYRLYALSNVGSLTALLSYPFLVEPALSTRWQGVIWSLGFCLFTLTCGYLAIRLWSARQPTAGEPLPKTDTRQPTWIQYSVWMLLPATASIVLLATTNHLCQDIAVVPFLWVAPLSIYLLTFIICFDREHWYSSQRCGALAALSAIGVCIMVEKGLHIRLLIEVASYLSLLFWTCMVCHGELVRSKPNAKYLTAFYLTTSLGGAAGGVLVAIVCPLVFSTHFEMNLSVLAAAMLGLIACLCDARRGGLAKTPTRRLLAGFACGGVMIYVGLVQLAGGPGDELQSCRNFYGVLHVGPTPDHTRTVMIHGRTTHGFQFSDPQRQQIPTSYYGRATGIGITLEQLRQDKPLRVGAVGLGVGTIAAYGQPGDQFRFYEINPAVVTMAQQQFSYLTHSPAENRIVLGDARLSLESEPPQQFDVLVLDAFSSDSIPTHLLTCEAFEIYRNHLAEDGVIAVHISNRHLRLDDVVVGLADHLNMECLRILNRANQDTGTYCAKWMLLTTNREFLKLPPLSTVAQTPRRAAHEKRPWTDQYNNLFQILTVY